MNEVKSPHELYRDQLASKLRSPTGNAAKILKREKSTLTYKVARALHREITHISG